MYHHKRIIFNCGEIFQLAISLYCGQNGRPIDSYIDKVLSVGLRIRELLRPYPLKGVIIKTRLVFLMWCNRGAKGEIKNRNCL